MESERIGAMIKARVLVFLKDDVMDPQGNAVASALQSLGHSDLRRLRVGRCFDITLEGSDPEKARGSIDQMCRELLANTVVERYEIHLTADAAAGAWAS